MGVQRNGSRIKGGRTGDQDQDGGDQQGEAEGPDRSQTRSEERGRNVGPRRDELDVAARSARSERGLNVRHSTRPTHKTQARPRQQRSERTSPSYPEDRIDAKKPAPARSRWPGQLTHLGTQPHGSRRPPHHSTRDARRHRPRPWGPSRMCGREQGFAIDLIPELVRTGRA
jgi:hypothetical protein